MADRFCLILDSCAEEHRENAATLLGTAFSLKSSTCETVMQSLPIVILDGLTRDECAAMLLALAPLSRAGVKLEFGDEDPTELPKIDWPKRPKIFKQEIATLLDAYQIELPTPRGSQPLIEMLRRHFDVQTGTASTPSSLPRSASTRTPATGNQPGSSTSKRESTRVGSRGDLTSVNLPEIAPFSQPLTSSSETSGVHRSPDTQSMDARMDEMFPDDDSDFIPRSDDITNILDRILPEEENTQQSGSQQVQTPGGCSVFLGKITDPGKQAKAVPLLVEIAGIDEAEAKNRVKKLIIPVVRGVDSKTAEQIRHRFAGLGILVRVKKD